MCVMIESTVTASTLTPQLITIKPVLAQLNAVVSAMQTMLLVFLSLGTLMVGCFFAYHCSLIVRGKTTNETFKWQDYKDHCIEMARESRCGGKAPSECAESVAIADSLHCWMQVPALNICPRYLSCSDLQADCSSQVLANLDPVA